MGHRDSTRFAWDRLPILVLLITVCASSSALAPNNVRKKQSPRSSTIFHIQLRTTINPITTDYLIRALEHARQEKARGLLIELDTPGGLMTSMRRMTRHILNAEVPVIVWVGPDGSQAASAGVFVTCAAHVASMSPGTTIGAAHPVQGSGRDIGDDMKEKVVKNAVAHLQTMARRHGRNTDMAASFVRESTVIDAGEASEKNVIDFTAESPEDLLEKLNGRTIQLQEDRSVTFEADDTITPFPMTWQEDLLNTLLNPNLVYFLAILGFLGLVTEFTNPGFGGGLILGGFCLLFALYGMSILPVDLTGLILILGGLCLMVADLFVPSLGLLTVGGLISFFLGSTMLFKSTPFTLSPIVIGGTCGAALVVILLLGSLIVRGQFSDVHIGDGLLVGKTGRVSSPLSPEGMIHVHGEYWSARCVTDTKVPEGVPVRVVKEENSRVLVEPIHSSSTSSGGPS